MLLEKCNTCQIKSPDDDFFDQIEMDNILNFTLSGQLWFICLMNHVRCTVSPQFRGQYCGMCQNIPTVHTPLSQFQEMRDCPTISISTERFSDSLLHSASKVTVVGLISGNNSHCVQPKCFEMKQAFDLSERLSKIMSRCHNADVQAFTSFLSSQTVLPLVDKPQLVHCKVIRNVHGHFITDGQDLDILTVYDPETHGFDAWLSSVINAVDLAAQSESKVMHVLYPASSGLGFQYRGLLIALLVIFIPYQLIFEKIVIHPDEGSYTGYSEGYGVVSKSLNFVFKQLQQLFQKYGSKARAGICLPGLNDGKICQSCSKQRYIYSLHNDTIEILQRYCPNIAKLIQVADFKAKTEQQGCICKLNICQLSTQEHANIGLQVGHNQVCDHSQFCFQSQCQRNHPARNSAELCNYGIMCKYLSYDDQTSLEHLKHFHHSSYITCQSKDCDETEDYHYQMLVHKVLFRKQCPLGSLCSEFQDPNHISQYWHLPQQTIHIENQISPLCFIFNSSMQPENNPQISQQIQTYQFNKTLPHLYLPLNLEQMIGICYANKFLTKTEIKIGNWWKNIEPTTIGQCVKLIQLGSKTPSIITWLQIFEGQQKQTTQSSAEKPIIKKSKYQLSSKPTIQPTIQSTFSNQSRDILLYDCELQIDEKIVLSNILQEFQQVIDEKRNNYCLSQFQKQYNELLLDHQVLFLNSQCIDVKNYWKEIAAHIYQKIATNETLSRLTKIALVKYKIDDNGQIQRSILVDMTKFSNELEESINASIKKLFDMEESYKFEYSNSINQQYTYNYAHVLAQFYSSGICYALYLQDNERIKLHNHINNLPKCNNINSTIPSASLLLNRNNESAENDDSGEAIIRLMLGLPEQLGQDILSVLRLTDSLLYSTECEVTFNDERYNILSDKDQQQLCELGEKIGFQNINILLKPSKIRNFNQTCIQKIYSFQDVPETHLLLRQIHANSGFKPFEQTTLQQIKLEKTQKTFGTSFTCENFVTLPIQFTNNSALIFTLLYNSDVCFKVQGQFLQIERFICTVDQQQFCLLDQREAQKVGYQKFVLRVNFDEKQPMISLKAMHQLIETTPVTVQGQSGQNQAEILSKKDGVYCLYSVETYVEDVKYGVKYRKKEGRQQLVDAYAVMQVRQYTQKLREGAQSQEVVGVMVEKLRNLMRVEESASFTQVLLAHENQIIENPEAFALLYAILVQNGLVEK